MHIHNNELLSVPTILPRLNLFEAYTLPLRCKWSIGSEQQCSLHRGGADQAVEPVVVGFFGGVISIRRRFRLVLRCGRVLGGDLIGEHAVSVVAIATKAALTFQADYPNQASAPRLLSRCARRVEIHSTMSRDSSVSATVVSCLHFSNDPA